MAALTALDPAVSITRDGVEFLVTEAGRSDRGLTATIHVGDGEPKLVDTVRLSHAKDRARFAAEVVGAVSIDAANVEAVLYQLLESVEIALRRQRSRPRLDDGECPYAATDTGLVYQRPTRDGTLPTPLTNFRARIVADITIDDAVELRRELELDAQVAGGVARRCIVPVHHFASLSWVIEHLGAGAIVYPGVAIKDHTRAAIQILSGTPPQRHILAHTGWRHLHGQWVYLHAGGALGFTDGTTIETRLPLDLAKYALPTPPTGDALLVAVRASLQLLTAATDIMVPLYAGIWRAVLGRVDFSLHLTGPTGVFKSELAALVQQHWGAGLDARHLPGAWSSTANALEGLAFHVKDAVLVVDDFAPQGTVYDVQRMHREADRLLRAQGNHAGRHRMRADTSLRPHKPPRSLILSTGEDTPRGQSLRARLLVLDVPPDAIQPAWLTARQHDAAAGRYAEALAAFVVWLAPRYGGIWDTWATHFNVVRDAAAQSNAHRRTPEIIANLALGLGWWLAFTHDMGVLTTDEVEALWSQAWIALGTVAAAQAEQQAAHEPAQRFLEFLHAVLVNGSAHVASPDGRRPVHADALGWRDDTACGERIGWVERSDLYLEPVAAYAAVQRLARTGGDGFAISLPTLKRRLHERGLLASVDDRGGKRRLDVRRVLEGERRAVLHLHMDSLYAEDVAQVAHQAQEDSKIAPIAWATLWATDHSEVAHRVAHENGSASNAIASNGSCEEPREHEAPHESAVAFGSTRSVDRQGPVPGVPPAREQDGQDDTTGGHGRERFRL